ncbi:MAG: lysozyme inhibitor LprI family protein [Ottowia sp.]|uniref:lysozyme inhibitor LprI family protein n=1 Tax=Ottowia sp. TaxID=1898956 RepID=UPI003C7665DB
MHRYCFKLLLTVLSASLPWAVLAADDPCFEKAQTQAQLNECAFNSWKRADVELNHLYQQMGDRLHSDQKARQLLVDTQRKWLSFRDAECAFQTMRSAGGSIQPMLERSCLADLTRVRITDFQNQLACAKAAGEQGASDCAIPPGSK